MKRFNLTLALALLSFAAFAATPALRYCDASTLTLLGKAIPTDKIYERVDASKYPVDKAVNRYHEFSTGLYLAFRTNSCNIGARWKTTDRIPSDNMTIIAQKGLDLYIRNAAGKWLFAGVARVSLKNSPDTFESKIVSDMAEGEKECLLYLPAWDKLLDLQIGIDEGAKIEPMQNPFGKRVVVLGSSITHGASASRPGMTYAARLGRDNGLDVVNLGYSGACKLQEGLARLIADTEADVFVFDTFSNPTIEEVEQRFDKFVDIVRAAHPTTPLVFLATEKRDRGNFNVKYDKWQAERAATAERLVRARMKKDKNIHFVDSKGWPGSDGCGTVDDTHPNDLGFTRMLQVITKPILKALK